MNGIPKLLSKTRLMRGYRCLKNIYLNIHEPSLETPISEDQQAVFDQGNAVGAEARKRFPGGVLIDNKPWDFIGSLKRTRELIANKTEIIYEAAFEHQGCYARADIIRYSPSSKRWSIFEVKSSTKGTDAVRLMHLLDPHVVVTDIIMPEFDIFDALEQMRKIRPSVKIIAISGNRHLLTLAARRGVHHVLQKPFDLRRLDVLIKDAMR